VNPISCKRPLALEWKTSATGARLSSSQNLVSPARRASFSLLTNWARVEIAQLQTHSDFARAPAKAAPQSEDSGRGGY
jgi:hypothetical protein